MQAAIGVEPAPSALHQKFDQELTVVWYYCYVWCMVWAKRYATADSPVVLGHKRTLPV